MKILVINGPNLNMLGIREKGLYGEISYKGLVAYIKDEAKILGAKVKVYQSNCEGPIITAIQKATNRYDGIIINAGGYTHTSIAIMDALKAVSLPVVEVHITDIYKRESYRHTSYIKEAAFASVVGEGIQGYGKALQLMKEHVEN